MLLLFMIEGPHENRKLLSCNKERRLTVLYMKSAKFCCDQLMFVLKIIKVLKKRFEITILLHLFCNVYLIYILCGVLIMYHPTECFVISERMIHHKH